MKVLLIMLMAIPVFAQQKPGADSVSVSWDNLQNAAILQVFSWDQHGPNRVNQDTTEYVYGIGKLISMEAFTEFLDSTRTNWITNRAVVRLNQVYMPLDSAFIAFLSQRFDEIYVERKKRGRSPIDTKRRP